MADAPFQRLEVRFTRSPEESILVGTLAEHEHRVYFEYDDAWLESGRELSPFKLAARPGLLEHTDRDFGPLPGLFDDSLPDGWGLLLMDRHFHRRGFDASTVSPLERLAYLGTETMGALTYHPPADREGVDPFLFDLHELSREAQAVYAGEAAEVLPQLLRAGGSPGGARPKVLVGFEPETGRLISGEQNLPEGFEHWMVKFAAREEVGDAGPIELAYARMAEAAGLDLPPTRLFETAEGNRFFGVRRFDRAQGNRRSHVHTFGNLVHANFRLPSCDYAQLFRATSILTRDHRDTLRLFRRMAFNVLAHNRDDHAKNFAYRFDLSDGSWSLSPAYDLTFAFGPGGEHTTTVLGEGRSPSSEQLLTLGEEYGVGRREGQAIITEIGEAVALWPELADEAGVSALVRGKIRERLLSGG